MNVTDKETERFLKLVREKYRSDAIKILSSTHVSFVCIKTNIKIYIIYHDNCISVIDKDAVKLIELGLVVASFKEDDADFIISYISRRFDKLKLIFSSSTTHVFAENTSNMSASVGCGFDYSNAFMVRLFCPNEFAASIDLSENNADVSDETWDIILSNQANVNRMMSEYVSGTYFVPDNIKKRIQALYESLPDSDKLLLELGEDLTNI